MISELKEKTFKFFDMDLGPMCQILGMQVSHDKNAKKLWLSHEKYVEQVLERLDMKNAKSFKMPLVNHFKPNKG